jgi:hypothetical protein|tara:strand:+ start:267 stop:398 length:132 start_codon:yes stop_codon:yes gene_type:complete
LEFQDEAMRTSRAKEAKQANHKILQQQIERNNISGTNKSKTAQ